MEAKLFRTLCIRERVIIAIVIVLMISSGTILYFINAAEKKIYSSSADSEPIFFHDYFSDIVFTGDIRSSFLLRRDFLANDKNIDSIKMLSIVHRLKNQVIIIFGVSLALGIALALLTSRGITRPIMRLVHASKNMTNGNVEEEITTSNCTELQILTESFKKMRTSLQDYEDEESRRRSVEITKNLAAGIAHEIKNPINTVGLITDYLQTNLSPDDPEKRYEFYKLSENMKSELKRINRIVEGFLRITKPDVYSFAEEDINSIIQHSASILEQEIVRQGIELDMKLNPSLPQINVDRERLTQVFSNLILNAIEAMPRGGKLTISTSLEDGQGRIQFSDNGIGIPQEDIKNIFSPYFTTKKQGFGLGLALIHDIVHKHRGKILVKSEKGRGTDFIIYLPVHEEDE